jgi:hypothetical protein
MLVVMNIRKSGESGATRSLSCRRGHDILADSGHPEQL